MPLSLYAAFFKQQSYLTVIFFHRLIINVKIEYAEFLSKLCTWEHCGRDLRFNCLAAGKMAQVSLQHLILPQAQFSFKSPHCIVHVCDDTLLPLKLQV